MVLDPEQGSLIHTFSEGLTGRRIVVAGFSIKLISSNVRQTDLDWPSMEVIPGLGKEGNLVLVEAVASSGSTNHVENQEGVDELINKGDKFIGVLANRYSGTSESGEIPLEGIEINPNTELHLLSTGGIVGINTGIPARMTQEPLKLKPLGLVSRGGELLDLLDLAGPHEKILKPSAPIVMVCGTSAEVGKTTTSKGIIRDLSDLGLKVAGTKFSGTGRMRDILDLRKSGANPALDFPDAGLPTTYTSPERFRTGTYTLFNHINEMKPDIIVAEAGGDPIEANVPTFLEDLALMCNVKTIIIAAGDVMGMMGAVLYLRRYVPDMQIFLTDPKDRNPISTRERVRHELPGIQIFNSLNPAEVRSVVTQIIQRFV